MDYINKSLKLIREYHRMKQNELAKELKLSASYISELEKGTKTPTLEILKKYSDFFHIPLSSIMMLSEVQNQPATKLSVKIADKALKILDWLSDTEMKLHPK